MTTTSGILAALGAPFVMTIGFVVWDKHWIGSAFALNMYKCLTASIGFAILSVTTRRGDLFPSEIFTVQNVGFLMLSSTIGILVGDWTWLESLRLIGARRVIVVDTCKPFLAAVLGWAFLGEALPPAAFGGMALTVVGVLIVSLEKEKIAEDEEDVSANSAPPSSEEEAVSEDMTQPTREHNSQGDVNINVTPPSIEEEGVSEDVMQPTCDVEETSSACDATTQHNSEDVVETISITEENSNDATNTQNNITETETRAKQFTTKAKATRRRSITPLQFRRGYVMAALNVVLDTFGSLLTKEYGNGMTTWEINLIRFGFAGVCLLSLSLVLRLRCWLLVHQGHDREKDHSVHVETGSGDNDEDDVNTVAASDENAWYLLPTMKRRSWFHVSLGVVFVTFLTPALSNYALFQIALALALTLGSVGPLYALPLTWLMQKERPTLRSCFGALVAVAGVVVLSILGST